MHRMSARTLCLLFVARLSFVTQQQELVVVLYTFPGLTVQLELRITVCLCKIVCSAQAVKDRVVLYQSRGMQDSE